jgi:glycosyltransferase involved in cell wall biosynthesis
VRVELLKKALEAEGHSCIVLNLGRSRTVPSPEYETVMNGWDYLRKVWRFSRAGYVIHMHVNGESPKGFMLTLIAETVNLVWGRRCIMTFHAGVDQVYFPRPKWPVLLPMFWVMFAIPRRIICNNEAVKDKICEYGVPRDKVVPIPAFSRQYLEHELVALSEPLGAFYGRFPHVVFAYIKIREGFYQDVLLDGFAEIARRRADVGLVILGISGDIDPGLLKDLHERIKRHQLAERICLIDDLEHDAFLTALTQSDLYLRTPTTDGVAASVLEALSLGVPVVASENGTRPAGVVTYEANSPRDLAATVIRVIDDRRSIAASIPRPQVRDTLADELRLLVVETA